MTIPRHKKQKTIFPERLAKLRRTTIITSTDASTYLADSKLSDKEVEQVANVFLGKSNNIE